MSENVPALRAEQGREVARTDTDSWVQVMRPVIALAEQVAHTDFVPKGLRNNVPATAAAILYGREVGLPPMTALTQTHVIDGKPAMSAEAMRAMVLAAGHHIVIDQTTGAQCTMRGRRAGSEEWTTITWTIDIARAAGVANKQVWKSYPRQMLQARATTELVRLVFPDVIHGFRSLEEFNELDGVLVEDEDGNTAPASTSRVSRARKSSAKKTTAARPAPTAAPAEPAAMDGPPLPGEPGFDDPTPPAATPVAEAAPVGGEDGGEAAEPPTGNQGEQEPGPGPVPAGQPGERDDDVVDGEVVEVDEAPKPGPSTRAQHRMLFGRFAAFDIEGDGERLAYTSALVGREIDSFNGMTKAEAHTLIETLTYVEDRPTLDALVDAAEERRG